MKKVLSLFALSILAFSAKSQTMTFQNTTGCSMVAAQATVQTMGACNFATNTLFHTVIPGNSTVSINSSNLVSPVPPSYAWQRVGFHPDGITCAGTPPPGCNRAAIRRSAIHAADTAQQGARRFTTAVTHARSVR